MHPVLLKEIIHWKAGPGKKVHVRVLISCDKVILISHTICGKVYHNIDIAAYLMTSVYHRVVGGMQLASFNCGERYPRLSASSYSTSNIMAT